MRKILTAATLGVSGIVGLTGLSNAHARPAASTVSIYGVLDEYVDFSNSGSGFGNHTRRVQSGGVAGSRIGFQGSEDLGAGLKALFVLEAGINADTGASGQGGLLFGRQSYVGLAGGFGQVTFGRQYSTYFDTLAYGLGGGMAWGNANNYFNEGSMLRIDNAVKYESPDMGGLVLKGLFGMGEKDSGADFFANRNRAGNIASIGGQYDNGPFSANLSYSSRQSAHDNLERWSALGVSWDFGAIKAGLLAIDVRDALALNRNNTIEASAEIPLPHASLLLDVGYFRNRALANANATAYSARYDHYLSKRTTLYTGVALIRNGRNAAFTTNGATGAGIFTAPGNNVRSLMAGVRHIF